VTLVPDSHHVAVYIVLSDLLL